MKVENYIEFILNGELTRVYFEKEKIEASTTVLSYLREKGFKAVKEACGEGDCGACSIVIGELGKDSKIHYRTLNSCMLFLPYLDGKEIITTEYLEGEELHPVQKAMVENHAIQCGYCTPGFTMSLFSLYHEQKPINREELDMSLSGNLCRCTGYKSIYKAGMQLDGVKREDKFTKNEKQISEQLEKLVEKELEVKVENQIYYKPKNLAEALKIREENPDAVLIAGASDVALLQNKRDVELKKIIDLSALAELNYFKETQNEYEWGAILSVENVRKQLPLLPWKDLLARFASKQIRNIASFGGNIANASPIGDTIPLLFAYKAKLRLVSSLGERVMLVEDFILGYRETALRQNEIIKSIILPKPHKNVYIKSYKISKRKHLDISTLSAAFRIEIADGVCQNVVLVYGGMAALVKRAKIAEQFLEGKSFEENNIKEAIKLIKQEFSPLSDVRAGEKYRKEVAGNLLLQFFEDYKSDLSI